MTKFLYGLTTLYLLAAPVCEAGNVQPGPYGLTGDATGMLFSRLIDQVENVTGIPVVHLAFEEQSDIRQRLAIPGAIRGLPLRLAAAGGSIGPIAVLYPDIGEPYRSVFWKIIEGIEDKTNAKVASYAVGPNFNPQTVSSDLKRQEIKVVIALGRNGLKAAGTLDREFGVIGGGVVSPPENETRSGTILSLAPDPSLLFSRLKALSPKVQRIHVVYDPRQSAWLIKLAREAARSHGQELIAQEAQDLKSALAIYQNILANADGKRDAVWLPQDSTTVEESLVLPLVLQESWNRGIPVFSSNVSHVKRGALFALYPNNVEIGRNLAASALGVVAGTSSARGLLPMRDVLTAFNTRTANHLGINPSSSQQQDFSLLFPEQ